MSNLSPREMTICRKQAEAHCNIRRAIDSGNAQRIAKTLKRFDSKRRVLQRFEYAIEWGILGKGKIPLWKEIKQIYDKIGT